MSEMERGVKREQRTADLALLYAAHARLDVFKHRSRKRGAR